MNPSSSGWILKLLNILKDNKSFKEQSIETTYNNLRKSGFIYGNNFKTIVDIDVKDLTEDEISKANLLLAFYNVYHSEKHEVDFLKSLKNFYSKINEINHSFFKDLFKSKDTDKILENVISKRIQIDDNLLAKNFNYFVINALLYVDVLTYSKYINDGNVSETYIKNLETAIQSIVLKTLNSKEEKSEYDDSLIKLIEQSMRFDNQDTITYEKAISYIETPIEAQYMLDIACMSTWGDQEIDSDECEFVETLGRDLKLEKNQISGSIESVNTFYKDHKNQLSLLNSKNVVENFYNNSSKLVNKLLIRNSKRLVKELAQSKELLKLIAKSTVSELTEKEQKKVQDQLIDIFKSIPSLAIFILPGGAILLPIVTKFIPNLLPSSFNDNKIDEEE